MEDEMSVTMVLVGDFNLSGDDRGKLKENLGEYCNLELKNCAVEQTTLHSVIQYDFFETHIVNKFYKTFFVNNVFR